MNMNKKNIIFILILFLCVFSVIAVDASVINNNSLFAAYVGENICAEDSVQRILKLVGYILIIAKILVPLIIIFMGTMDLFNAVTGKDDKVLFKSLKSLGLRLVLGILIFFIPNIVNFAFDLYYETAGGTNNKQCITCVLDPNNC